MIQSALEGKILVVAFTLASKVITILGFLGELVYSLNNLMWFHNIRDMFICTCVLQGCVRGCLGTAASKARR